MLLPAMKSFEFVKGCRRVPRLDECDRRETQPLDGSSELITRLNPNPNLPWL